jgi:hypothetical protein
MRNQNPNSLKNLKMFSKDYQPKENGRPKGSLTSGKILEKFLKVERETTNPVSGTIESLSIAEEMALKQIQSALKGDLPAYREIIDRIEGKSISRTELKAEVEERPQIIFRKKKEDE